MQELLLGDSELIYQVGGRADAIFSIISSFVILRRPDPGGASREQLWGPAPRSAPPKCWRDRSEAADAMVAALLTTITRAKITEKKKLPTIGPNSVCLVPLEQTLIDQMSGPPLTIDRFPFFIGRKSANTDSYIDGPAALILQDRRLFRLSRRHFSIDRADGLFVVCDHRSFHGAIVNGIALTASGGGPKSPLDPGENELIAGDAVSPFRFTCIIPS